LPLAADFSPVAPLRAEALLHAFPPEDGPPDADWALPFRRRWGEVENAMRWLESEGLTMPSDDVDAVAAAAYAVGSHGQLA
jgi:hypothetical protein